MSTDPDHHLDSLLAAARSSAVDTSRSEYGFETRLLARLREERENSTGMMAWRLCPFFAALAVALALWNHLLPTEGVAGFPRLAEAGQPADEQAIVRYLTGDPHP